MSLSVEHNRDLVILERIEQNPDATQASLAGQLGVAVGTINWHIKRLVSKGYVKVRRVERRKLRYIITPEGLALRAMLTVDYIQTSFEMYRLVRQRMLHAIAEVRSAGYEQVGLRGEGDVADVCRLTCLEQGVQVVNADTVPQLEIVGLKVLIDWNGSPNGQKSVNSETFYSENPSSEGNHSA
jgi:DNA-binding MarR family transcriptional regulator